MVLRYLAAGVLKQSLLFLTAMDDDGRVETKR